MASVDIIHGTHLGAVVISEESSFGTTGTERRAFPVGDTLDVDVQQAVVEAPTLKIRPFDPNAPVRGNKTCTAKVGYYLQPATTVLTAGATADTDAAAPLRILMRCILGGESVFAGSDVAAASSSSAFDVTAGHGSRFPEGQIILVDTAANATFAPARVLTRVTDALTCYPALSATPTVGGDIRNTYTWYVTRTNTKSLSLGLSSAQDSSRQWRLQGLTGGVEFSFERNALAMATFDLKGASWAGPSALSISTSHAADTMAAPLACRSAVVFLQATTTTTRVAYSIDAFKVTVKPGNAHIESLTSTEGVRGVYRSEGLLESFADIELTTPADSDHDTWWAAKTELTCMLSILVEVTGGGQRYIVVDAPRCVIIQKPKSVKGAGNLDKHVIMLRCLLDTSTTGTLDNEQLAESALRIAIG